MLTKEQIIEAVQAGRKSGDWMSSRDYGRLLAFFDLSQWGIFGFEPKENAEHVAQEFTRENVLEQLRKDVDFGFEKALNQRGLSAGAMNAVVLMWMWVLEDELQSHDSYAQYGLPLLKAVAVKYGFPNEIGDDEGDEPKYACD